MNASILDSWAALPAAQQLFFGIGIIAGGVSLILAVMSAVGLEHHDVVDLPE